MTTAPRFDLSKIILLCSLSFSVLAVGRAVADDLVLTEDTTVDVPAGVTNVYQRLSGAFTLTKTGGGFLFVRRATDAATKVVVKGGEFRFAAERPAALADAMIHLDAAAAATLTTEEQNGTNFVTRWTDAEGGAYEATNTAETRDWRTNPENRRAYLSDDQTEVGLPMVDMGTPMVKGITDGLGETIGYGAAMTLNVAKKRSCVEFFTVTSDNEEWKQSYLNGQYGPNFLGCTYSEMDGRRGASATGSYPALFVQWSSNVGSQYCYFGTNEIDGVRVASNSRFPDGVHVLHCIPTNAIYANALGRNYRGEGATCDTFGGIRYGEVLIFTNQLTGVDRANVTDYLVTKWRRQTLASVTVDGGRFAVDGGLNVDVGEYVVKQNANLFVPAGVDKTFDTVNDLDIYAHFDASDVASLVTNVANGTNFVTRWKSLNDPEGLFATNYWGYLYNGGIPTFRPDPENRLPYVTEAAAPTGLRVVDFGSFLFAEDSDGSEGYGAALVWNRNLTKNQKYVAEFFTVAADDATRARTSKTYGVGSYLGSIANEGAGIRGRNGEIFWDSTAGDVNVLTTKAQHIFVDNDGGSTTNDYSRKPSAGFHVVNAVPSAKINASAFAHNHRASKNGTSANAYGGMKIGEFLALKTAIADDVTRTNVNAYLMHKWLGTPRVVRSYELIEIPSGSSLDVVCEGVSATRLSVGGSLSAPVVTNVAAVTATSVSGTIAAPLALADGATLDFAQKADGTWTALTLDSVVAEGGVTIRIDLANPRAARGQTVRLMAAENLPAAFAQATVSCPKAAAGVSLDVRPDGLYAVFSKPGFVMSVR